MIGSTVEVIGSKGCSRLFVGISAPVSSFSSLRTTKLMTPASSAISETSAFIASGPFTGLVICVTGLSKEARKQVMAATERLGGQYSPSLHPQCTHLVVQSFGGRKLEHALRHGPRNGLSVVTLGWFVDSVKRNVRLSESLYSVKSVEENGLPSGDVNQLLGFQGTESSCLPVLPFADKSFSMNRQPNLELTVEESKSVVSVFYNNGIYIDPKVTDELRKKVVDAAAREGATILDHWFVGCQANYVVCEGPSISRYIGHTSNLVTPLWILKTIKEKTLQRLVHLSSDLARQVARNLETAETSHSGQETNGGSIGTFPMKSGKSFTCDKGRGSLGERQKIVDSAKMGVRSRRYRRMQLCQVPIQPITPGSLLDYICWSICEPSTSACIYTESSGTEDTSEQHTSIFYDARVDGRESEASFDNFSRPLRESEKRVMIFKNHFLTILFPVDRFGELGPCSKTFFSNGGFTCLQVLDHIYDFYQENMSLDEIEVAIHTDSKHADRLRALYVSKEAIDQGFVPFKRIDLLGSRRSFEALKRVGGENNNNVYELLIRA